MPFSYEEPMVQPFFGAERLYCYDASRENANYNVFTLFMERVTGETQLIRLRGSGNEEFVALDLSNYCTNDCIDTRFALLNVSRLRPEPGPKPEPKSTPSSFLVGIDDVEDSAVKGENEENGKDVAACYLMSKDRRVHPFQYSVTLSSSVDVAPQKSMFKSERPLPRTDRIVCFKNYRAIPAKQRYIEEFLV